MRENLRIQRLLLGCFVGLELLAKDLEQTERLLRPVGRLERTRYQRALPVVIGLEVLLDVHDGSRVGST